jgi:hypothetical protein
MTGRGTVVWAADPFRIEGHCIRDSNRDCVRHRTAEREVLGPLARKL